LPTLGLAQAWDFTLDSWPGLSLAWKGWVLGLLAWTLGLWTAHARWALLVCKPVEHRLLWSRGIPLAHPPAAPFGPWNQFYRPEMNSYEVHLPGWPEEFSGFSLVQLSDLHHGKFVPRTYLEEVLRAAAREKPDIFVLTGDLIFLKRDIEGLKGLLRRLRAPRGTYAVLGNHDHWADGDGVRRLLEGEGVRLLRNEAVRFKKKGKTLALIGTDDLWMGTQDEGAVVGVQADAKILLAHHPDQFPLAKKAGIHLQVSGHCHGGQVRLPLIGPLIVPSAFGRRHAAGFLREGDSTLFINRGVGGFPPVRVLCPPEVVKLVLRPWKS